mmetsp:Transcript_582/g.1491  ORF Transcript_582/g.1491 Transcript_582/m.1491 type:complete len:288 (-) Transcript_582:130-993(-)
MPTLRLTDLFHPFFEAKTSGFSRRTSVVCLEYLSIRRHERIVPGDALELETVAPGGREHFESGFGRVRLLAGYRFFHDLLSYLCDAGGLRCRPLGSGLFWFRLGRARGLGSLRGNLLFGVGVGLGLTKFPFLLEFLKLLPRFFSFSRILDVTERLSSFRHCTFGTDLNVVLIRAVQPLQEPAVSVLYILDDHRHDRFLLTVRCPKVFIEVFRHEFVVHEIPFVLSSPCTTTTENVVVQERRDEIVVVVLLRRFWLGRRSGSRGRGVRVGIGRRRHGGRDRRRGRGWR